MREDQDLPDGPQLTGPAALRHLADAASAADPTRAQPSAPGADSAEEEVRLGLLGDVDPDRKFWPEDDEPGRRSWWLRRRRQKQEPEPAARPAATAAEDDQDPEDDQDADEEWDLSGERRRGVPPMALRAAILGATAAALIAVWALWPSGADEARQPPAAELPAASPSISEQPVTLETLPPLPQASSPGSLSASAKPAPTRPAARSTRTPAAQPTRPRRSATPTPTRTRSARPTPAPIPSQTPLPESGPSEAPPVPTGPAPTASEPPYTGPSEPPPVP
ncbi:hypothetical protein GCM10010156_66510 [Planobispora rosea]|uniref:Uncharacterized protein n=1 Tax=Planobispora rosea TaxID=35762 RepID=A0A8J3SAB3_PLARO|nr:hypothetical protein [Planobispora rosea]GGS99065.1 hypothetical protein GCM10010156_66510 [Planobispora rosea]GIH88014.1 hypothetical protein Pro02_64220 [Planobispora rosea]